MNDCRSDVDRVAEFTSLVRARAVNNSDSGLWGFRSNAISNQEGFLPLQVRPTAFEMPFQPK